ncbi:hypothetical protein TW80_16445 [Loktanella sp. S4079]|nr:hypothetical protein TW80_16445 [Loktanella sp. S4079]
MITATLAATPAMADPLWTAGPFDMPESAIFDPDSNRIIVSVIGGNPGEADGNGSLALLAADGEILDEVWTTGMDAPKGMAIVEDTLLVADLTRVHEVDLASGKLLRSISAPGAIFLNDITSQNGVAFVSDFMGHKIWRYENGALTLWVDEPALNHPNGLLLDGVSLLVGSWGEGVQQDFSTEKPGSLLSIDISTQEISLIAKDIGNLDGIARIEGQLLVNDWITGTLYEVLTDGNVRPVSQYAPGLADISSHGSMLLLPSMLEGTISARNYP